MQNLHDTWHRKKIHETSHKYNNQVTYMQKYQVTTTTCRNQDKQNKLDK